MKLLRRSKKTARLSFSKERLCEEERGRKTPPLDGERRKKGEQREKEETLPGDKHIEKRKRRGGLGPVVSIHSRSS